VYCLYGRSKIQYQRHF